jgi:hypothetical protein
VSCACEANADEWRERGEQLRRQGRDFLAADLAKPLRDEPELIAACRAVLATELTVTAKRIRTSTSIPWLGAAGWEALVMAIR